MTPILTRHFIDRWRRRVGTEPNAAAVAAILAEAIILQRGRTYRLAAGGYWNSLTLYWHPARRLVITADRDVMVSVITERVAADRGPRSEFHRRTPAPAPGHHGPDAG